MDEWGRDGRRGRGCEWVSGAGSVNGAEAEGESKVSRAEVVRVWAGFASGAEVVSGAGVACS